MSLLKVDNLAVTAAGSSTALLGPLNFELAAGEKLGIIGESGSGKSLTALSIMGLLPDGVRASGSVTVDGHEVVGTRDARIRPLRGKTMAMVFPRNGRMRASRVPTTSWPSTVTEPLARTPSGKSPMMDSAVSDFPEPDSPIMPSFSPAASSKLSGPRRAVLDPAAVTARLSTLSRLIARILSGGDRGGHGGRRQAG